MNWSASELRVMKVVAGNVSRSYYDGQMPIEEDVSTGTLTRNFVGARGIEAISTTQNSATTTKYPLYDVHGNMVATLSKNTAGTSWSVGDERSYDVWGGVRSGATTGGPKGRYVANLGHVQDDESGLIYMRARYYEPESGRFVSEDPARDGLNWYIYCASNPVGRVDSSGKNWLNASVIEAFKIIIFREVLAASSAQLARAILQASFGKLIESLQKQIIITQAENAAIHAEYQAILADPDLTVEEMMTKLEACTAKLNVNTGKLGVLKICLASSNSFLTQMLHLVDALDY